MSVNPSADALTTSSEIQGVIESDISPFVKEFVESAKEHNVGLDMSGWSVVFGDTSAITGIKEAVGYCDMDHKTVYVDPGYWMYTSSEGELLAAAQKQELVDHEMGHCLLGKAHNEATAASDESIPYSIMTPLTMKPIHYLAFKEHYRDELFDKSTFGELPMLILESELAMKK
jgi:hypothetical protein